MKRIIRIVCSTLITTLMIAALSISTFAATSVPLAVTGITASSSSGKWEAISDGTVLNGSVTGTSSLGGLITNTTSDTLTFTATQSATLSFDYTMTLNGGSFTIDGTSYTAKGTFKKDMTAGSTVSVKITSAKGANNTAKASISNISFKNNNATSITFMPVDGLSYVVGDTTVNATSGSQTIEVSEETVTVVPTYSSEGVKIREWQLADGSVYSYNETLLEKPNESVTLTPVVAHESIAAFRVWGTTKNYYDWTAAFSAAGDNGTVVVAENGTLPAGDYSIGANQTLLIPHNASHTVLTTAPEIYPLNSYDGTPPAYSAYRTLTMEDGAKITVNGAISIGGQQVAGSKDTGSACGPAGFIQMETGSLITVNSGASLYAWGYVTGSGSVVANSGAKIYEDFQVTSYHGGDVTKTLANDTTRGIFPINQYYVQNIEVPLTLYAGALEYAHFAVGYSGLGGYVSKTVTIDFMGISDAMFNIASGYIVKDYIEHEDRLKMTIAGDFSIDALKLKVQVDTLITADINSATHDLPIHHNMTVNIESGTTTINQDLLFFPGAKVIIGSGATCKLGSGINLYFYDLDHLYVDYNGSKLSYCGGAYSAVFRAVKNAPGRTYTRKTTDLVDAALEINGTLDATEGCIYTTVGTPVQEGTEISDTEGGGANIYSTGNGEISLSAGSATYAYQSVRNAKSDPIYYHIPIVPAVLTNADTTRVYSGTNTYRYIDGKWVCETHTGVETDHTCDVCGYVTACTDADTDHVCDICGESMCAHEDMTHIEAVAATCTEPGNSEYFTCSNCGGYFSDEEGTTAIEENSWVIGALGHTYPEQPAFTWAEDYSCSASLTCDVCEDGTENKTLSGDCTVTSETTAATCQSEGKTVYTAKVTLNNQEYTDIQTVTIGKDASNHVYGDPTYTWSDDGSSCTASHACSCGTTETETATINNEQSKAPTCIAKGETTYTAEFNADWAATQTKTIADIDMIAHADAEKDGNHICDTEGCSKVVTSCSGGTATCLVQATCEECGQPYGEKDTDNHTGNTHTDNVKAETCGEEGYTGDEVCECGVTIIEGEPISATGNHSYGDWVVTKEPTTTEVGSQSKTCSVCGDVVTEEIPMVEVTGYSVTLDDRTIGGNNKAYTSLDPTKTYNAGDTFTVACAQACVVAISTDNGGTYTELTCTAVESVENTYLFTIPEINSTFEIFIALRGDIRIDGKLNAFDKVALAKGLLSEDMDNYEALNKLNTLTANTRVDTKLNAFDKVALAKGLLSEDMDNYEALKWNIAS